MSMELKITSPSEDGYIKSIEFNYEELKSELSTRLERYQKVAYTDDTIADAKKDRATLNRLKKALNAKRIEIKKLCLAPYESFESKLKELTGMVDEPVLAIDTQVKGYEERKKQEKQGQIEALWESQESSVKTLITLAHIFDQRWLNASYALSKVEGEISCFLKKVETELALIEELNTEFENQVIRVYLSGFNVAEALSENKKLIEQKSKHEEYRRQQDEAAKKQQEFKSPPVKQTPPTPATEPDIEPTEQVDFRVWATQAQLNELKSFLRGRGIAYGPVPHDHEQAA